VLRGCRVVWCERFLLSFLFFLSCLSVAVVPLVVQKRGTFFRSLFSRREGRSVEQDAFSFIRPL
jgi:hypothetical protein